MIDKPRRVEAVALDAMGVIYPAGDDLRQLLIPFLRSRGCVVADEAIIEAYRACYRHGAPASTIWEASGCDWADDDLERDFLACYELVPGVVDFLEAVREAGVPVFGLSNDVSEWAPTRRETLGIDGYFSGWAISAEVKAPKPAPEIYQALLAMLDCAPAACIFVDDRKENLEAATGFGLQTALLGEDSAWTGDSVRDFDALTQLVLSRR